MRNSTANPRRLGRAQRVAVLAPMQVELRPLVRPLSLRRVSGDRSLLRGRIADVEVVSVLTGVGPRAGARAAERALDAGEIDHLVVVGIAGGIGPSVAIGDLVVPDRVVDLASGAEYRPAGLGRTVARGALATSDGLVTDQREIARLRAMGVVAIDMETAAVAGVCERRGCPWSVFRAISDRADDGSVDDAIFGLAGADGSANLPAVLRFVLTRPWRVPQLARLARGMNAATRCAAGAAVSALRGEAE